MQITTILFDLDGTLTDSGEGIMNCVRYAIEKFGHSVEEDQLPGFVGPPLQQHFQEVCGVGAAEGKQLVSFYRERYTDIGIFENRVYPGVIELLEQLKQQGYVICMATSKPEIFASRIAEHFKFAKYFDIIGGSLLDGKKVKKSEVIEYVLEKAHVQVREQVLMIGDRYHDIIGAKEAKIHSMGVLYGYGDRKELEEVGAEFIASTPEEVFRMISSIV